MNWASVIVSIIPESVRAPVLAIILFLFALGAYKFVKEWLPW